MCADTTLPNPPSIRPDIADLPALFRSLVLVIYGPGERGKRAACHALAVDVRHVRRYCDGTRGIPPRAWRLLFDAATASMRRKAEHLEQHTRDVKAAIAAIPLEVARVEARLREIRRLKNKPLV